jgi:hypothetical protein
MYVNAKYVHCVGVYLWEGVVNKGDEGEGMWLTSFIYIYIRNRTLAIALSGVGMDLCWEGRKGGAI